MHPPRIYQPLEQQHRQRPPDKPRQDLFADFDRLGLRIGRSYRCPTPRDAGVRLFGVQQVHRQLLVACQDIVIGFVQADAGEGIDGKVVPKARPAILAGPS